MNRWALMLQQSPPELQRLIARTQRVSLPHGCDAAERLRRLRRAIFSTAAVRSTYAILDHDARMALETLRCRRGGIGVDELVRQYGPIRSLRQLARDPRPQSIAERLLLLGWLLPRPVAPHHPPRYVLPPELRQRLPRPLALDIAGPAPTPPLAPALRATTAILLVCAATPLSVRADGLLRRNAIRTLAPLLALDIAATDDLCAFVLPLLQQLGLVTLFQGRCAITPAAATFLSSSISVQRERLIDAWIARPAPDRWLCRLRLSLRGVDWPLLRRRLLHWAQLLPLNQLVVADRLYDRMASALGPLVDAQTHGFRTIRRTPWRPQKAAHAWSTALHCPLQWLGVVTWYDNCVYRSAAPSVAAAAWRLGLPGEVSIPFGATDADALQLSAYGSWVRGDQETLTFRVAARRTSPHMALRGRPGSYQELVHLLERHAGHIPVDWEALAGEPVAPLRMFDGVMLLADDPAELQRVARSRSVRRYLRERPAPGIALVRRDDVAPLRRVFNRHDVSVQGDVPMPVRPDNPPDGLKPGDCAALLAACAFFRRYAPADMPLLLDDDLEAWLQRSLSPALRDTVESVITRLDGLARPPTETRDAVMPDAPLSDHALSDSSIALTMETPRSDSAAPDAAHTANPLPALHRALSRRDLITIDYDTGGSGHGECRTVRPLELEQRGGVWYLRAYCLRRRAERTFRVDRIRRIM